MCTLSVVTKAMDRFQMDSTPQVDLPGADGPTSERLSGTSQD